MQFKPREPTLSLRLEGPPLHHLSTLWNRFCTGRMSVHSGEVLPRDWGQVSHRLGTHTPKVTSDIHIKWNISTFKDCRHLHEIFFALVS